MSRRSDETDKIFNFGIFPSKKMIFISDGDSEVDDSMRDKVVKGLVCLDGTYSDKPITAILSTQGGCEYAGLGIYDAVKNCESETVAHVFGSVMSMGVIILQGFGWRIMSPNARLMVHYGSIGADTHTEDFIRIAKEAGELSKVYENILLGRIREKHPRYKRAQLKKLLSFDTYMSAREAVELGLADEVG